MPAGGQSCQLHLALLEASGKLASGRLPKGRDAIPLRLHNTCYGWVPERLFCNFNFARLWDRFSRGSRSSYLSWRRGRGFDRSWQLGDSSNPTSLSWDPIYIHYALYTSYIYTRRVHHTFWPQQFSQDLDLLLMPIRLFFFFIKKRTTKRIKLSIRLRFDKTNIWVRNDGIAIVWSECWRNVCLQIQIQIRIQTEKILVIVQGICMEWTFVQRLFKKANI